jgi:hypothetical protein
VVGLRTIKNGKRVIGILFGIIALIEGIFAIYIAKPTAIKSIGGITQTTFTLAGVQLVILGAAMILVWSFYKSKRMEGTLGRIIPIVMLLASAIMICEGIAAAYLSSDIMIGTVQGVSKKFVALGGAQLFILGMVQLSLWIRRDKGRHNWLFEWGTIVLTVILLGEGVLIMGIAGDTTITGIGTVLKRTIFLAGLQLFLLAGIMLVLQLFWEKEFIAKRLGQKRLNIILSLLALLVAFEGLVMAYFTEPITAMKYADSSLTDTFGKLFISLAAAQLFAIGLLIFSFLRLAEAKLDRKILTEFIGIGSGIVLATEGAWVLGISGNTRIAYELGGIITRTVMIAGLGLVLLGLVVVFVWSYKNNWVVKKIAGKGRIDVLMLIVGLITGLSGVVLSALSANVLIAGFGSVSAKYIELAGIQLVLLASIMVLMWALRIDGISQRMKRLSYMVALFMMLLIPAAILM